MAGIKGVDLTTLVGEMTASMLGASVTEVPVGEPDEQRHVIGCVHLTADEWSGSILVGMPERTARQATATMFMLGPDEVDDDLVIDAMGEFANVLAGMAKGAIGGGCQLSLPSVTTGSGLKVSVPGADVVDRRAYDSDLGHLTVTTLESK